MDQLTLTIPYHSQPHYLRRALQSLALQTSHQWQAVVCDDSATGEAESVVAEFSHLPIVHTRNAPGGGVTRNWNFAVSQVTSGLFCLFHADDELEPRYVETMKDLAAKHSEAAAYYCQAVVIGADGRRVFSFPDWIKRFFEGNGAWPRVWKGEAAAAQILKGNFIFCPSVVYRTAYFPKDKFKESLSQVMDLDLFVRILESNHAFVGIPELLYRYRRHSDNLTAQQTRSLLRFREEFLLYSELAEHFERIGWTSAARVGRRKTILKLHLSYRALEDMAKLNWTNMSAKYRLLQSWSEAP